MKLKILGLVVLGALMVGCATSRPVDRVPFNDAEYARLPESGTGVITGQVFMKTVGGDVKYGAGSPVNLFPVTSYSEQWYDVMFVQHKQLAEPNPKANKYFRTVQADGNGNFQFSDIPPGDYFINSVVQWQAPTQFGLSNQGGMLANRIKVENGKTTRVMITR